MSKGERLLLSVYCIVPRLPRVFQVGGGIVKDIRYPFADTKGGQRGERVLLRVCCIGRGFQVWSKGEGVLLRVYCIVSRIARVV